MPHDTDNLDNPDSTNIPDDLPPTRIAISNQKGGVAKTTDATSSVSTVLNFASGSLTKTTQPTR